MLHQLELYFLVCSKVTGKLCCPKEMAGRFLFSKLILYFKLDCIHSQIIFEINIKYNCNDINA